MTTWRKRYGLLIEAAGHDAWQRMMRDQATIYLVVKPADPDGDWGELATISQAESTPDGWELATPERVPMSTVETIKRFIYDLQLPLIGATS